MKLIKLTNTNNETKNNTKWGENVTHETHGHAELCTNTVLHAYTDINVAVLLNPVHANLPEFNIWEAEGSVIVSDWGKVGCKRLTTIKQIDPPAWYTSKKKLDVIVTFAKCCARYAAARYAADAARYAATADAAAAADAADAARYAAADADADSFDVVSISKQAIAIVEWNN